MNRVKKMANIILKIEVNAQRMRLRSSRTPIVAGSTNLYLLDFEFSDVWDGASRYVQISDGQQTAEYQLLSEPLLLPASFYRQPGKITLTVWGTTSAQTLRVENAVLLEVVQACFTEGLTPQEPPEGLPEDVFVRSRNTPITADGSQADGKYISFLARDDAGTFYYYDADAQSYVPVRDAYRGAVESGYAGTESAFYTDLKNVHTFSLQAQQSAEEAARIEASIVYLLRSWKTVPKSRSPIATERISPRFLTEKREILAKRETRAIKANKVKKAIPELLPGQILPENLQL